MGWHQWSAHQFFMYCVDNKMLYWILSDLAPRRFGQFDRNCFWSTFLIELVISASWNHGLGHIIATFSLWHCDIYILFLLRILLMLLLLYMWLLHIFLVNQCQSMTAYDLWNQCTLDKNELLRLVTFVLTDLLIHRGIAVIRLMTIGWYGFLTSVIWSQCCLEMIAAHIRVFF